jgi:hypothetical protein
MIREGVRRAGKGGDAGIRGLDDLRWGWAFVLPMLCRWGASVREWGRFGWGVAAAEPTLLGALPLRIRVVRVTHPAIVH